MRTTPSPTLILRAVLRATLSAGALLLTANCASAATAPEPGDYTALPAGTNLTMLYGQNVQADHTYADGNKVALPGDLDLNINVGVFRQVHYMKLGGYTIDPQIVIPYARQSNGLTGDKVSGVGDVVFGGTLWTIADAAGGEHLGYTLFLTAPTGAGKGQGFAVSDDRWAADLQAGYIRRLTPDWTLDLVGQAEFYQDRRDTGAKKDPLARAFVHVRRTLAPGTELSASLRYAMGAKETLAGSTLAGRKADTNLGLTLSSFVTKQLQLQAQFNQDVHVESGPKLGTLELRALIAY